jgi:hypothetical protein
VEPEPNPPWKIPMIKSSYEVVCYEPGLKAQIIRLQCHLWGPSETLNTAYFEWKYERNPYVHTPLIYLAMHEGRIVGMRGFHGMQLEGGNPNQKSIALYADDLVIDPDHRNRGLFRKIMAAAFDDLAKLEYRYALNMSAGKVNLLPSLTMGWRSVGSVQPMRYRSLSAALYSAGEPLTRRLPLAPRTTRRSEKKKQFFSDVDAARAGRILARTPWIQIEDNPRSLDMAGLVKKIGDNGRIRQVRDPLYFDWRFQNPQSQYKFLFWAKTGLEGYLVLQQYTSPNADDGIVNIVDWEATSIPIHTELLQVAMKLIAKRRLNIWSVSLPPQLKAILENSGFKLEQQVQTVAQDPSALLVRPIRDVEIENTWQFAGQSVLEMKSWDIRMLFSMRG